jgi:hypothetical protein
VLISTLRRLWFRIFDRIETLYYDINCGIPNLIAYAPLLIKDRDGDYSYLLRLMELKLRRMADHQAWHSDLVRSDKTTQELRIAAMLCARLESGDYEFSIIRPYTKFSAMRRQELGKQDLDMLTRLINRKLFTWWD